MSIGHPARCAACASGDVGDALPILALALQRLIANHRAPDGRVTLKPGETREFIATAVAEATTEALQAVGASPDDLRRLIIPKLATWDPKAGLEGAAKRQVATAAELFTGARMDLFKLAEALIAQRLLTRSQTESGPAYEIAHEALLRNDPMGPLISERRQSFEQVRMLEVERHEWHISGCARERLGRAGRRLQDARSLLEDEDFGPDLRMKQVAPGEPEEPSVADYLAACAAYEREQINKLRRTTAVAFVPPSAQSFEDGDFDRTLRLSLAAAILSNDPEFELTPELLSFLMPACLQLRLRATFSHQLKLTTLALSPREPIVVIGSSDRSLSVRHVNDGSLIIRLTGHDEGINCAKFSSDGVFLATASGGRCTSNDDSVCIWSTADWSLVSKFKLHHMVKWCGVTSDGRFCFAVDDLGQATVFSVAQNKELFSVDVERGLSSDRSDEPCPVVLIDTHAIFIAVGSYKGGAIFYQLRDGGADPLQVSDSARIRLICASGDQRLVACFRQGGHIQLLSAEGLKEIISFYTNIRTQIIFCSLPATNVY
jgi:hypothetical protein